MSLESTAPQDMPQHFATLNASQYAQLTTYRKNGAGVPTPVWFAHEQGIIYVMTPARTGKIKRIRSNGRATLAPCKANGQVLGASIECSARVLEEGEENVARYTLARKYGLLFRIFSGVQRLRGIQSRFLAIQSAQN